MMVSLICGSIMSNDGLVMQTVHTQFINVLSTVVIGCNIDAKEISTIQSII